MDIRPLAISFVWWFLIVVAECGARTVTTATKSALSGSVVNQHAEQPVCERSRGILTCHVPALDDNIDFRNYTGNIVSLNLYCDKKRYLPSRLLDALFAPLEQILRFIHIYNCYIINISRHAFGGLERLEYLRIIGVGESYPDMDNSWLEISTVSNSTQSSQTKLSLLSSSWYNYNLVLPEGVFSELHNLVSLTLTAMRLNSSVWHAVKHLRNLYYLDLNNNNITIIDINTTNNLTKLETLDLSDNHIQTIPTGTFESLSLLWHLYLSGNGIRFIEREAFKGLNELLTLRLSGNSIRTIDKDIFKGLSKLNSLDLSGNSIRTIDKDIFKGLSKLNSLDLSGNSIRTIDKDIFKGLSKLNSLDLSGNSIRTIDKDIFKGLSKLNSLDLSGNSIRTIDKDIFKGLSKMYRLDLSENSIRTVDMYTFKGLDGLRILDLSVNNISAVEMDTFKSLSNMKQLYLSENRVKTLSFLALSRLTSLRKLDLSCNRIKKLPKFPVSLNTLNLRNNSIVEVNNTSFAGLQSLTHLDLSHNKLSNYTQCKIPYALKHLNLSSNELSVASLNMTTDLVFADFRNNNLVSLAINVLKDFRYARDTGQIYLAGNGDPFRCTCNIEVSTNKSTFRYDSTNVPQYHLWNLTSLNCMSVTENTHEAEITEISTRKFSCNTTCYDKCICYHWRFGSDNINIVDCLGAGLTAVPDNISASSTILDLSGNMLQSLLPENFIGLPQVMELYLNSSNISEIKEDCFRELSRLRKLDLSNNSIRSLDSGIFKGLSRLSFLNISFNLVHVVVEHTFRYLNGLTDLDLVGNKIETISSSDIETMYTIASLTLSKNLWSCECKFLEIFKPFITEKAKNITDYFAIDCFTSNKTAYHIFKLVLAKFCPQDDRTVYKTDRTGYYIAGVLVFIVIVFGILFKNREFIKILCYITWDWRRGNNEMDRPYDAFISYSSDDNAFIVRELMPRLEEPGHNRPAYQLCVHFRDFPVGACIANTILAAINRSKRVIVILSNNFLNSAWCHYEFQAAHYQLIEEKKSRIIMVLLHEIDTSLLDNKLKLYLRTRTYVKFGDPLFWNKIEYAMPKLEGVDENPAADDVRLIP